MTTLHSSESSCPACGTPTRLAGMDALCPGCLFGAALGQPPAEEAPAAPALEEFNGYVLEKVIGRGGCGVVFLARRTGSSLPFALKMLASAHLAGPDEIRRFRFEAEAVFQLDHRHIIRVTDLGEHEGVPYFVMDFAEGGNLADRLDQPFDPVSAQAGLPQLVRLIVKVSRAVHFAHERGVLHRDLKPANILIDRHGEPLVGDFGLARLLHAPSGVTMTGATLGTPSYMSPEQAAGGSVTTATDLFSLGVILFQMLTGRTPFEGGSAIEILRRVTTEEVPDPRQLAPWIDRDLATICLTALRREPARRYASVAVFADDLERWQRGEPVQARPLSALVRMAKWSRRHPVSATFGLTGGIAAIALVTLFITGSILLRKERNNALQQEAIANGNARAARESEQAAKAARDQFQLNAYAADVYLAFRANADGHLGQARRMLARHLPDPGQKDLRGFEWHALNRLCRGDDTMNFQDHGAAVMAVAFNPSGSLLASAGRDGRVVVRSVGSWEPVLELPKADAPRDLAEIPLMTAVTARSQEMSALVLAGGINPTELRMRGRPSRLGEINCLAWSPDGTRLLTGGIGNFVRVWSVPGGGLEGLIPVITAREIAFSADGRLLMVFRSQPENALRHEWRVYQASDLSLLRSLGGLQEPHAISRDGTLVAVMPEGANRIQLVNPRDASVTASWETGFQVRQLAFSADGTTLFGAEQSGIMIACWRVADGQRSGSVFPIAGRFGRFLPMQDGRRMVSTGAGQTLSLQAIQADSAAVTLRGHEDLVHALDCSSDGRWIASGGNDHSCRIWQASPAATSAPGNADFETTPAGPPPTIPLPGSERIVWAKSRLGYWVGDGERNGTLRFHPEGDSAHAKDFPPPDSQYARLVPSPDGRSLAAISWPRDLRWLDPERGSWSRPWRLSEGTVGPVVISPDGLWLASGGDDNAVTIRSRKSGEVLAVLRGHQGRILDIAISPDSRTLASSADDATLRLWHVATWRDLGTLHQGETLDQLMFSKSGDVLRGRTTTGQVRDFGGSGH